ncbi:MAG: hypothetical protein ABS87_09110 [Sphingomonas sp. SCN 67-18]|uniref:hypothetical protein n=1 Tax=uncultured Sphingomonas sp. TaxID=158754 RepID=UPI00086AF79D|nr:hypothetical protein [Sphingomonas sp. SCN 67-18]ODU20843.1 MAG: hypothetical protein ABS87_09110 [Sphingomonas sp. SCN 67-18]
MGSGQIFVISLIAISTIGWVFTSWIRARHGYPVEGEWGGSVSRSDPDEDRKLAFLAGENEKLRGQLLRLEERISVLERIATDPAERTARDIDALR